MVHSLSEYVPLGQYTTLGVGGTARYFSVVKNLDELRSAWQFAQQTAKPAFVLGGGSNVLFVDGLLERTIIKPDFFGINYSQSNGEIFVTARAGESWDKLVLDTVSRGLSGLENLSGIPGTVGAAPVQNINCYGATVADVIDSVEVFDGGNQIIRTLKKEECHFDYRDSIFKRSGGVNMIVTAVTFRLARSSGANLTYRSASQSIEQYLSERGIDKPTSKDVREAILWARDNIGMLAGQYRSAGSFFKNTVISKRKFNQLFKQITGKHMTLHQQFSPWHWPLSDDREKVSTAFLLECSPYNKTTYGKKRIAGVGFSPKHSLSIVTEPGTSAEAVCSFVEMVTEQIKKQFDIDLEKEIVLVK